MRPRHLAPLATSLVTVLIATPAIAAPERVMTVPARAQPIGTPLVFALPSGDALVVASSGAELRYAVRAHGRWRPPRHLPKRFTGISEVSGSQRAERVVLGWLGRGPTTGSRALLLADFHGVARPPRLLRVPQAGVALDPVVSADPGGGAHAVWQTGFTTLNEGAGRISGTWMSVASIPIDAAGTAPSMASDRAGRRVVVAAVRDGAVSAPWWALAGPRRSLPALRALDPGGSGRSVQQMTPIFRTAGRPAVVFSTVALQRFPSAELRAVSLLGGRPAPPRLISSGERVALGGLQVGSLRDGRLVVVWRRLAAPKVQVVVANETRPGGRWTSPAVISRPGTRPGSPDLVVTPTGTPIVAWSEGRRVVARALHVGSRLEPAAALNLSARLPDCGQPSLAVAARTLSAAFTCDAGRALFVSSVNVPGAAAAPGRWPGGRRPRVRRRRAPGRGG